MGKIFSAALVMAAGLGLAGASVAQAFAMNHPGLYAGVATFGGGAYDDAYARGEEPAEANDLHLWPGKALVPVWKQRKREVGAAVWLFGASVTAFFRCSVASAVLDSLL